MQSCLICDDHAMIREALAGVVRMSWPDANITLVSDFDAAFTAIERQPDLCLCDLSMPGAEPLEGIRRLQLISGSTTILVVTASEDDELLVSLLREGIAGFIPKTSRTALIEAAIRVTLAGGRYVPPRVLELASRRGEGETSDTVTRETGSHLTGRQIDVLRLVAKGRSNKEIARDLGLSPATVKAHIATILSVLDATNRTEAVIVAERRGLI
jgi:DNA-binding NarL/FixJ family response regulator